MIEESKLDHIAVAGEAKEALWQRYAADLGGRWAQGGIDPGFHWSQFEYANGMRVEVLEPHNVEIYDFLRRFLDHNGPGAHHLTYKVPDITAAIEAADAAGYPPVGVNLSHEWWKEAFLHPKNAPGIVVQLAFSPERPDGDVDDGDDADWESATPPSLPAPRTRAPAALVRVVHAVADLDEGIRLWIDLLGGVQAGEGDAGDCRWIDIAWPGPGRLRLVAPASPDSHLAGWLGDRRGRLHHLAFTVDEPTSVTGARPLGGDLTEVAASENFGVRLVLAVEEDALLSNVPAP